MRSHAKGERAVGVSHPRAQELVGHLQEVLSESLCTPTLVFFLSSTPSFTKQFLLDSQDFLLLLLLSTGGGGKVSEWLHGAELPAGISPSTMAPSGPGYGATIPSGPRQKDVAPSAAGYTAKTPPGGGHVVVAPSGPGQDTPSAQTEKDVTGWGP